MSSEFPVPPSQLPLICKTAESSNAAGNRGSFKEPNQSLGYLYFENLLAQNNNTAFLHSFCLWSPLALGWLPAASQVYEPFRRAAESQGDSLGDKTRIREVIPAVTEAGSAGL